VIILAPPNTGNRRGNSGLSAENTCTFAAQRPRSCITFQSKRVKCRVPRSGFQFTNRTPSWANHPIPLRRLRRTILPIASCPLLTNNEPVAVSAVSAVLTGGIHLTMAPWKTPGCSGRPRHENPTWAGDNEGRNRLCNAGEAEPSGKSMRKYMSPGPV